MHLCLRVSLWVGQDEYEFYELLPMLLLGVVGGLLGSAFIVLNARLAVWRKHTLSKYGRRGKVLEGLAISVLTSVVSFGLPLLFECQVSVLGRLSGLPHCLTLLSRCVIELSDRGGRQNTTYIKSLMCSRCYVDARSALGFKCCGGCVEW